ncbi:hypothetical protein ACWEP4_39725 [Streptomyces sp. NPDC004227]
MGRHMWGKTAAGAFLAVTVAAVSGCGPGLKGPHGEKTAAPKTVSVTKAAADFQAVINDYDTVGCESQDWLCWGVTQIRSKPATR